MDEEKRKKLDSIGFTWKVREAYISVPWEVRFQQLVEYKRFHGDCNVPQKYKATPKLGSWVHTQRGRYMMSEGRRKKLDSVGFIWNVRKAKKSIAFHWKVRFQELVEYKRIHGHCNIHKGYAANPQLALLVGTQRSTKETMSENRRNKLNSIDFVWSLTAGSSKDNDSALIEDLKSTLKSWVERLIEIKIKHFPGETMPSPAQLHVAELLKNSKASEYELAETMKVLNLELLTEGL